ncbi:MAG: S-layer homology domain-containing protein, partial [Butyricicoccus sp.]
NNFTDVPADSYYKDAVQWAVDNNITTGTSATTFAPNAGCTRGQIVTFLYRQLGK